MNEHRVIIKNEPEVTEEKYRNGNITDSLRSIQAMLRVELEHWFKTDNSATSTKIAQYDAAIELLVGFVEAKDVTSFVLVFAKYGITIDGLRDCFRSSGPDVKNKRNEAHRLFATVCLKMVATKPNVLST